MKRAIEMLSAVLETDVAELDLDAAELKRLLSEFRCHLRSTSQVRKRRVRYNNVLYAVDKKRLSYALHHGLLPGCVCKCRMPDADAGRLDAMECYYEP